MTAALLAIGALLAAAIVAKGFQSLLSKRRSGPDNNWTNEAYAAREEQGSWAENEHSVANSSSAPSSMM